MNSVSRISLLGLAALALSASANAAIVFQDNFEPGVASNATSLQGSGTTPDVSTYTVGNTSGQANTTLWVRATGGYNASRNGLIDESENGGANFTDPTGTQAWAGRYSSNTGITSAFSTIGTLAVGQTITVSFDAVIDGHNSGSAINVYLAVFDGASTRTQAQADMNNMFGALARYTDTATASYANYSFSYTVGDDVYDNNGTVSGGTGTGNWNTSLLGKDIAIRFKHTNGAIIDNVVVDISVIPEPRAALLGALGLLALLRRRR